MPRRRMRLDSLTEAEADALLTMAVTAEANGFDEGEMFRDGRKEAAAVRAIEKLRTFVNKT